MPNPKVRRGHLRDRKAVKELKAGRVEFRVEKAGIVPSYREKLLFGPDKLFEDLVALIETIIRAEAGSVRELI